MGPHLFLDANVIYSVTLTDVFIQMNVDEVARVTWSTYVEEEALRSLLAEEGLPDGGEREVGLKRRFDYMLDYARLPKHEHVVRWASASSPGLDVRLPDRADVPVLGDAVASGATTLVTFNLKDFPRGRLSSHGIRPIHPDTALLALLSESEGAFVVALEVMRNRKKNPPWTPATVVDRLRRAQCPKTASRLLTLGYGS